MIFNFGKYTFLNELEIDGKNVDDEEERDYTQDEQPEDNDNDVTVDDVEDTGDEDEDYTQMEMPEDDEPEDDAGDDTENDNDNTNEENNNDSNKAVSDVEKDNNPPPEDDGGEDDDVDYTQMDDDDLDDGDDTGGDGGGEDAGTDDGGDAGDENTDQNDGAADDNGDGKNDSAEDGETGDGIGDPSLADMEKDLFADLTPAQMAIKNTELLQNYIDLYEALNSTFDNVNKISKNYYNTRLIEFIADKIVDLRDMVNYTITTTYVTRTYVENLTVYKQCLVIYHQIGTMLKGLIQKPSTKK